MRFFACRETEDPLRYYRFLGGNAKASINDFFSILEEPYRTYARKRYIESKTIEQIAEEMGYSPRTIYNFRQKVLKYWLIFSSNS